MKQHRPSPLYATDEEIHKAGHQVLRLPVAHCELNPIELAWASVKGYVAKHNTRFTMTETKQLTIDGFQHTTTDMWRKFCRHVVDIENDYFEKDGLVEDMVEDFVIDVSDNSASEDESEDEADWLDDDDRLLIDCPTEQEHLVSTSTEQSISADASTSTARTDTRSSECILEQFDKQFLQEVLPLP